MKIEESKKPWLVLKMKRKFVSATLILWCLWVLIGSCGTPFIPVVVPGTKAPLTSEEAGEGLKQALINGTTKGVEWLSQANGYGGNPEIRIPFPPDAKRAEDRLRQIGMGKEVDRFIQTLNHGAEEAVKEAKPIFIHAIREMTIDDAFGILNGGQDAATQFLERTTSAKLHATFKPIIRQTLGQVSATRYYSDLINTYNKIPLVEKVNPELDDYATERAIHGLFVMIAKEEKNIRNNPAARTTEILKRVFAKLQ